MATALILIPDPDKPGEVIPREYPQLTKAWLEGGGVLAVKVDEDSETVYFAPGAWHSYTRGDRLPQAPLAGASRVW